MKKSIKIIARSMVAFAVAAVMAMSVVHAAEPAQDVAPTYEEIASMRLAMVEGLFEGFALTEKSEVLIAYIELINAVAELLDLDAALVGLLILDDFLSFLDEADSLFAELFAHIVAVRFDMPE